MRLATSSYDPACQERRNITHAFYHHYFTYRYFFHVLK